MGTVKKEILIGFLVSVFATFGGMFVYLEYVSNFGFFETMGLIKENKLLGPVLALAAIPNLFVFFVFLKKKQDYRARGVLLATISIAIISFILKLT